MRIMLSSLYFFFTLVVGSILFVVASVQVPGVMNELFDLAAKVPTLFQTWGLSDTYVVWLKALGNGAPLVLLGFLFVTRVIFSLIGAVFGLDD